jgi:hypothetical protein
MDATRPRALDNRELTALRTAIHERLVSLGLPARLREEASLDPASLDPAAMLASLERDGTLERVVRGVAAGPAAVAGASGDMAASTDSAVHGGNDTSVPIKRIWDGFGV